jgi:glycine cleavage system protein P-like pyridoxal-binding family
MQDVLKIIYELKKDLCEISETDCFSLQQAAGARTGRAYGAFNRS